MTTRGRTSRDKVKTLEVREVGEDRSRRGRLKKGQLEGFQAVKPSVFRGGCYPVEAEF